MLTLDMNSGDKIIQAFIKEDIKQRTGCIFAV